MSSMPNGGMRFIFTLLTLVGLVGLGLPAFARAEINALSIEVSSEGAELLKFNTNNPISIGKSFALSNPERIVIDIPSTGGKGVNLPRNYKGSLLKAVRFGQFDARTSRIVLDLKAPATILATKNGAPFTVEIAPVSTSKPEAKTQTPAPAPVPAPILPLVVIDAGHGDHDPGATGLHGTREKDITLNYARALRDALIKTGRYRAVLTRDADQFIMLHERVAIARAAKGDVFISLHADSNPKPEARGLSIYTLSENASDGEAAALAERENKADIIPGIDLNTTDADVASILIDLTQRETMNKSARLADAIVASMSGKINRLQKTHRFAGFRVLKAPDIPSVLVELGFLSNATDERLLLTPDYRDTVISSIVKGIDRYLAD